MSDLGEKVFEVQYDVVCRLIPGFVTIGVYPGILNLESILNGDGDASWASRWVIALIPAYLIGFALEHISLLLVERLVFEGVVLFRLKNVNGRFATIYGKWFGKNLRKNCEIWGGCNSGKTDWSKEYSKCFQSMQCSGA